jgi:hypothetical protein
MLFSESSCTNVAIVCIVLYVGMLFEVVKRSVSLRFVWSLGVILPKGRCLGKEGKAEGEEQGDKAERMHQQREPPPRYASHELIVLAIFEQVRENNIINSYVGLVRAVWGVRKGRQVILCKEIIRRVGRYEGVWQHGREVGIIFPPPNAEWCRHASTHTCQRTVNKSIIWRGMSEEQRVRINRVSMVHTRSTSAHSTQTRIADGCGY